MAALPRYMRPYPIPELTRLVVPSNSIPEDGGPQESILQESILQESIL